MPSSKKIPTLPAVCPGSSTKRNVCPRQSSVQASLYVLSAGRHTNGVYDTPDFPKKVRYTSIIRDILSRVFCIPILHCSLAITCASGNRALIGSNPAVWSQCSCVKSIHSGCKFFCSSTESGPAGSFGSITTQGAALPPRLSVCSYMI